MRKSKLEPFKERIIELLSEGNTYNQIVDHLYYEHDIDTTESAVCTFVNNNHLRDSIQIKKPVCTQCENYIEIGTKYIQTRSSNVRVCKACLEVIPQAAYISPTFCPRRKENKID